MSTTITLELSDAVAEALATPEGLRQAAALLEAAFAEEERPIEENEARMAALLAEPKLAALWNSPAEDKAWASL
jgi:hypothetical protein